MTSIVSRHSRNLAGSLVLIVVLAGIIALAPFMLLPASTISHPAVAIAVGVACLALAALVVREIGRRDAETSAWTLTDDMLVGGVDSRHRIRIADIVEVSAGVPVRAGNVETVWHRSGLVLKLRGDRLLALNLLQAENGPALMEALAARCASVFTTAPAHTARELALLHRLRWNRIVGADEHG